MSNGRRVGGLFPTVSLVGFGYQVVFCRGESFQLCYPPTIWYRGALPPTLEVGIRIRVESSSLKRSRPPRLQRSMTMLRTSAEWLSTLVVYSTKYMHPHAS